MDASHLTACLQGAERERPLRERSGTSVELTHLAVHSSDSSHPEEEGSRLHGRPHSRLTMLRGRIGQRGEGHAYSGLADHRPGYPLSATTLIPELKATRNVREDQSGGWATPRRAEAPPDLAEIDGDGQEAQHVAWKVKNVVIAVFLIGIVIALLPYVLGIALVVGAVALIAYPFYRKRKKRMEWGASPARTPAATAPGMVAWSTQPVSTSPSPGSSMVAAPASPLIERRTYDPEGWARGSGGSPAEKITRLDVSPGITMTIRMGPVVSSRFVTVQRGVEQREAATIPAVPADPLPVHAESRRRWAEAAGPTYQGKYQNYKPIVEDSRKAQGERVDLTAKPVPLRAYYTTYEDMRPEQRAWYLRWRHEWISGRPLNADPSYLFLCTYELLNFLLISDTHKSYRALATLYEEYRNAQPKLENYLPSWLGDLSWELSLHHEAIEWWARSPADRGVADGARSLLDDNKKENHSPAELFSIYTYPPTAYTKKDPEGMLRFLKSVADDADAYCRQADGRPLEEVIAFGRKPYEARRNLHSFYRGAVIARDVDPRPVPESDYSATWAMQKAFEEFFQAAENAHRAGTGWKRMLKVERQFLDPLLRRYIKERLPEFVSALPEFRDKNVKQTQKKPTRKAKSGKVAEPVPAEANVALDLEVAKRIQEQSDRFSEELGETSESAADIELDEAPSLAGPAVIPADESHLGATGETPDEGPGAQDGELPLTDAEIAVLRLFLMNDEVPERRARETARKHGMMINNLVETLNEKALAHIGDTLVSLGEDCLTLNPDLGPTLRARLQVNA